MTPAPAPVLRSTSAPFGKRRPDISRGVSGPGRASHAAQFIKPALSDQGPAPRKRTRGGSAQIDARQSQQDRPRPAPPNLSRPAWATPRHRADRSLQRRALVTGALVGEDPADTADPRQSRSRSRSRTFSSRPYSCRRAQRDPAKASGGVGKSDKTSPCALGH